MLEQLYRALQRRDVFASPSHRWSDPRARLLDGTEWEAVREDVLAGLSLDLPVAERGVRRSTALMRVPSAQQLGARGELDWSRGAIDSVTMRALKRGT